MYIFEQAKRKIKTLVNLDAQSKAELEWNCTWCVRCHIHI